VDLTPRPEVDSEYRIDNSPLRCQRRGIHTEMVRISTVLPVLLGASRLGLLEVRPGS
jgi:hypothetical protein